MDDYSTDAIPANSSIALEIQGESVLLCNSGGTHYAIENRCTHQNTPLSEGRIRNGFISCPLHGVRFELATGEPRGQLTKIALKTYAVNEQEGIVRIRIVND